MLAVLNAMNCAIVYEVPTRSRRSHPGHLLGRSNRVDMCVRDIRKAEISQIKSLTYEAYLLVTEISKTRYASRTPCDTSPGGYLRIVSLAG